MSAIYYLKQTETEMTQTQLVESLRPAFEGGKAVNQLTAAGALLDRLKDLLEGIDLPPKEDVLAAVGTAYDAYVAPVDIPGVPNAIEPWVDAALKSIILRSAGSIYDSLVSK